MLLALRVWGFGMGSELRKGSELSSATELARDPVPSYPGSTRSVEMSDGEDDGGGGKAAVVNFGFNEPERAAPLGGRRAKAIKQQKAKMRTGTFGGLGQRHPSMQHAMLLLRPACTARAPLPAQPAAEWCLHACMHLTAAPLNTSCSTESMGLSIPVLRAIKRKGFRLPTPIQRRAMPLILQGVDMIGMARTGSGKTAAFVIPMVEK